MSESLSLHSFFLASLIFASKARLDTIRGPTQVGLRLILANIRISRKNFLILYSLAYFDKRPKLVIYLRPFIILSCSQLVCLSLSFTSILV